MSLDCEQIKSSIKISGPKDSKTHDQRLLAQETYRAVFFVNDPTFFKMNQILIKPL